MTLERAVGSVGGAPRHSVVVQLATLPAFLDIPSPLFAHDGGSEELFIPRPKNGQGLTSRKRQGAGSNEARAATEMRAGSVRGLEGRIGNNSQECPLLLSTSLWVL